MTHDPHHLTGAYAAGALDDDERAEVEAHLSECADCAAEVADLREALTELSVLAEADPPPALRETVLASIKHVRPLPPLTSDGAPAVQEGSPLASVTTLRSRRRVVTWITSAAAAVALILGGLVWHPWNSGDSRLTAQSVLNASDARTWSAPVGGGRATVARSAQLGGVALVLEGLGAPPERHGYEAWLQMPDGSMAPAGMVPSGPSGRRTLLLTGDAARAVGVGLTVEPEAGSTKPTTPPLLLLPMT
jgi:anti-sigma-K factor RskA